MLLNVYNGDRLCGAPRLVPASGQGRATGTAANEIGSPRSQRGKAARNAHGFLISPNAILRPSRAGLDPANRRIVTKGNEKLAMVADQMAQKMEAGDPFALYGRIGYL